MKTPIENRDLTQHAPHSPRDHFGGFAIIGRTIDKCRASIGGTLGDYHYDCPLDNQLFSFKGINGAQFKAIVTTAKNYEDVADWLQANGIPRSENEIKAWSQKVEAAKLKDITATKSESDAREIRDSAEKLGLDFDTATLFAWLDADDQTVNNHAATATTSHR